MIHEKRFLSAVFNVIEYLNEAELRNSSKRLIIAYLNESKAVTFSGKARHAIIRHTQQDIPQLQEVRDRGKRSDLTDLDHLILKMEYEAEKLQLQREKR